MKRLLARCAYRALVTVGHACYDVSCKLYAVVVPKVGPA